MEHSAAGWPSEETCASRSGSRPRLAIAQQPCLRGSFHGLARPKQLCVQWVRSRSHQLCCSLLANPGQLPAQPGGHPRVCRSAGHAVPGQPCSPVPRLPCPCGPCSAARAAKAERVAPRPVAGLLRPVVSGQVRAAASPAAPRSNSAPWAALLAAGRPAAAAGRLNHTAHAQQLRSPPRIGLATETSMRHPGAPPSPPYSCMFPSNDWLTTPNPPPCRLQTVKYNTKKRAGRGFTLEELKASFRPQLASADCSLLSFASRCCVPGVCVFCWPCPTCQQHPAGAEPAAAVGALGHRSRRLSRPRTPQPTRQPAQT